MAAPLGLLDGDFHRGANAADLFGVRLLLADHGPLVAHDDLPSGAVGPDIDDLLLETRVDKEVPEIPHLFRAGGRIEDDLFRLCDLLPAGASLIDRPMARGEQEAGAGMYVEIPDGIAAECDRTTVGCEPAL